MGRDLVREPSSNVPEDASPAADLHKVRSELNWIEGIVSATARDWAEIDRWLPASKRGSNLTRALNELRQRVETIASCVADAKAALDAPAQPSGIDMEGRG